MTSRARTPRRRAALAGLLTLIATATACTSSGGANSPSGSNGAAPLSGGNLTFLVEQTQLTLDPGVSPADVTALIDRNIFDSLVVQTGPATFAPWLATKWTTSPDGLTYTFTLRTGVRFHDGTPFDAAAVKATLDHAVAPATKSQYAASLIKPYKSSRVVNPSTVEVTLASPFRPLLQALSTPYLGIQSPASLKVPADKYKPVGTGPFRYLSWTQQKDVTLTRNDSYDSPPTGAAHTGAAYLQTLHFNLVNEDSTRYGALTSGQAQGVAAVPPIDMDTLTKTPGFQVLTAPAPGGNYNLFFNTTHGPTTDLAVRRALQAAIDVPTLVKAVYFGHYAPATSVLGPTTADYDATAATAQQPYDPAKAGQLLDQAGWTGRDSAGYRTKDGQELKLEWPYLELINQEQRDVLGQGIVAQAKKVGIHIDRPNLDVGTFSDRITKGTYDVMDTSFVRGDPDILRTLFASTATFAKGGANMSNADSPELDALLQTGATTSDPQAAKTAYSKVQAYVVRNAFALPVYVPQYTLGASDKLHGITFGQQAFPLFYDAWLSP